MSRDILLTQIDPDPTQPRKHFGDADLKELAQSIQSTGLATPIMVRPAGSRFVIVYGERRFRAAKSLGWEKIPAEVRDISAEEAGWLALVENVQRSDLSPIEEAQAYKVRLDTGITQDQLGQRIGKTQSYIAQKLRLLKLPESIQFYLNRNLISEGHARQLMRFKKFYTDEVKTAFSVAQPLPEVQDFNPSAYLRDMRPEDNPPAWFFLLGPSKEGWGKGKPPTVEGAKSGEGDYRQEWDDFGVRAGAIANGCRLLDSRIVEAGGVFPYWEVTAFWWASFVVYTDISVKDLSEWIDGYIERIYSAISYVTLRSWRKEPPVYNPEEIKAEIKKTRSENKKESLKYLLCRQTVDDLFWWGCRSDIRHAGFNLDNLPQSVSWQALGQAARQGFYIAPSQCQPWGLQNEQYRECKAYINWREEKYVT